MKKILPRFYSDACLSVAPPAEGRAEMLRMIDGGETEFIEFEAVTFVHGPNRNHLTFREGELPEFAASFAGQPFLRNHDLNDIGARDGTISDSKLVGKEFHQVIRLTTRQGMLDYLEGRIDRFSIGWEFKDILCSVCGLSWELCSHMPGRTYERVPGGAKLACELIFTEPRGRETSAVNSPAVDGTHILTALHTFKEEYTMNDSPTTGSTPSTPTEARLEQNRETIAALLGEAERQKALDSALTASNATLAATCGYLLSAALSASKLPEITQGRLRKTFEGKVFGASELQTAIDEARAEVSALTGSLAVQGPGRVSGMYDSADKMQAAFDDLLGAKREPGAETLNVPRLSGIREAYLMLTGDRDFHGGYYPMQTQLATTADFSGLVKNALNKMIVSDWAQMGAAGYDWWRNIVKVEHFETLNDITGTLIGTVGSLSTVLEGAEYTELAIGDSPETASFIKKGGYIPLTLELIDRDETRKLRAYPSELARAALRELSATIAAIFTQASGTGPTMADTGVLFNSTAVTTAGGHANLLTTALSVAQWDVVAAAMYNQPMLNKQATGYYGVGKKMALEPKFCLVPRALRLTAMDCFMNGWITTDNKHTENMLKGMVQPLVVPEWTDANDWAAVADPNMAPSIIVGERFGLVPEVFVAGRDNDPAVFMNDETRIKVRHFTAVLVGDFRPLHKENV